MHQFSVLFVLVAAQSVVSQNTIKQYPVLWPTATTALPPTKFNPWASTGTAKAYKLVDEFKGESFFEGFNFEAIPDPTNGHVVYKSQQDAVALNLTYIGNDGLAYIHVEHKEVTVGGRASIRLSTKKSYTKGLFILDFHHTPQGCATWPVRATHTMLMTGVLDCCDRRLAEARRD